MRELNHHWRSRTEHWLRRASELEDERNRLRAALIEIEETLQEGSEVPLPRLRAWNIARSARSDSRAFRREQES